MTRQNDSSDEPSSLSPQAYAFVRGFLREQIGYELGDGKEYLVENRLAPIAAAFDLVSVSQLIARLQHSSDRRIRQAVIEAMTINETSFFRARRSFDALVKVMIPSLIQARAGVRRLRLWCAACSTGQEAYSIAFSLADHFPQLESWHIDVIATDVSERALEQARQGFYNHFEVQRGLPIQSLLKHFTKHGDRWQVSEKLRRRIEFRNHNLLDSFLPLSPPLDIIFLRNALIYFDNSSKAGLFARLRQAIARDGYLVLGEAESVLGLTDRFIIPAGGTDYFLPNNRD